MSPAYRGARLGQSFARRSVPNFRCADGHHLLWSHGSGKTSGPAKHFARSYLAHGFGGVVLCSKKDERPMWEQWAEEAGRWNRQKQQGDLIIIDKSGKWRFNFLDWEASRAGEGGGLTINIVALLDEIHRPAPGRQRIRLEGKSLCGGWMAEAGRDLDSVFLR
jgi:hypothetical protein